MQSCTKHMFHDPNCHNCVFAATAQRAAREGERIRNRGAQDREANFQASQQRAQRDREDAQRRAQWAADRPRREAENARVRGKRSERWARLAKEDAAAGKPSDALRLRAGIIAAAVTFIVLMGGVGSPGSARVVAFIAFATLVIQAILRNAEGGFPNVLRIGARESVVLGVFVVALLLGAHGMTLFISPSISTGAFVARIFGLLVGSAATGALAWRMRKAPRPARV